MEYTKRTIKHDQVHTRTVLAKNVDRNRRVNTHEKAEVRTPLCSRVWFRHVYRTAAHGHAPFDVAHSLSGGYNKDVAFPREESTAMLAVAIVAPPKSLRPTAKNFCMCNPWHLNLASLVVRDISQLEN